MNWIRNPMTLPEDLRSVHYYTGTLLITLTKNSEFKDYVVSFNLISSVYPSSSLVGNIINFLSEDEKVIQVGNSCSTLFTSNLA